MIALPERPASAREAERDPARNPIPAVVVAAIGAMSFVALCAFAAHYGPRGSDQYWYVSHLAALVEGRGVVSNNIFPASLLPAPQPLPRPFVHNSLPVYLAVPAGLIAGPYWGWIVSNVGFTLLTAALIFLTARRVSGDVPGLVAASLYLFLPLTFWQACQPLAESGIVAIVAATAYIYSLPDGLRWRWPVMMVLAGLLLFCRTSFLPLLIGLPLAYLLHGRSLRPRRLAWAALMVVAGVGFVFAQRALFPQNVPRSITQILMSQVPGKTNNMEPFFNPVPLPFSLADFLLKAKTGILEQFDPSDVKTGLLFYAPFNILAVGGLVLGWKRLRSERVYICAAFFVALHFATVVAFQNQPRYMLIAMPATIVLAGAVAGGAAARWARLLPAVLVVVMLFGLGAGTLLAKHVRAESRTEKTGQSKLLQAFRVVPEDEAVMVETGSRASYLLIAYALEPRPVVIVRNSHSPEQYRRMADRAHVKWLFCDAESEIPSMIGARVLLQAELDLAQGDRRRLFRLAE